MHPDFDGGLAYHGYIEVNWRALDRHGIRQEVCIPSSFL